MLYSSLYQVLLYGLNQEVDNIQLVNPPLLLLIPVAQLLFIVNELMIGQGLLGLDQMGRLWKAILSLNEFFSGSAISPNYLLTNMTFDNEQDLSGQILPFGS